MSRPLFAVLLTLCLQSGWSLLGQDSNWKRTDSDSPYFHQIELRDALGRVIDPNGSDPSHPDLSKTCAPCHDVESAAGGLHGGAGLDGRAGEPWFLVDSRSASAIPFHSRSWPGLFDPDDLGLDGSRWARTFGRHDTGGSGGISPAGSDCLVCHLTGGYDFARRIERVDAGDPAIATFIAAGLLDNSGNYHLSRFDRDNKVSLELLSDAGSGACLHCHSVKDLDSAENSRWLHDEDIHLAAGMSCVDCHRSGIDHHMVRGFEGEEHPAGIEVSSLSCRGCHMAAEGGHSAAPKPLHAGLPPFHLDEIHCTGCHSGPVPDLTGIRQWTSRAHRLGEPSQSRSPADPPRIIFAGIDQDESGKLGPVRRAWPEGWGILDGDGNLNPIPPDTLRRPLRKALRVRSNLIKEMTEKLSDSDADNLIADALLQIEETIEGQGTPVLIMGSRVLARDSDGGLTEMDSDLASAISWPLGHPVRSARTAVGAGGCTDCHSATSSWLTMPVGPESPLPVAGTPAPRSALDDDVVDRKRWNSWSQLFQGRELGKVYYSICFLLAISGSLLALWRSLAQEAR